MTAGNTWADGEPRLPVPDLRPDVLGDKSAPRDAKDCILDAKPGDAFVRFDVDFEKLRQWRNDARQPTVARLILMKRFDSVPAGDALVDGVIAVLAATAAALWPVWCSDVDFSGWQPAGPGNWTAVGEALAGLPGASPIWFAWAARRMLAGRTLARNGFSRETALRQTRLAISREGLILVIAVSETSPAPGLLPGLVHAAEWLARRGLAVVVLLPPTLEGRPELAALAAAPVQRTAAVPPPVGSPPERPERPPDGPVEPAVAQPAEPAAEPQAMPANALRGGRITPGPVEAVAVPRAAPADDLWLWPVTGRPHPLSEAERRLAEALRQDAVLSALFGFNRRVRTVYQSEPIVDLLWAEGRVVVEVDGDSHRQPDQYAADRHRDFELLVSGYAVLRLSNEEVLTDTARAVAKIRKVVSIRQHPPPETGFA